MEHITSTFLILTISQAIFGQELSPVVVTQEGQVQGSVKYTPEGKRFYAFQGIPYAKPPLGPLRFKASEPAEPWSGVLQVTSDPTPCLQITFGGQSLTKGVEDCLHLSLYTPQLSSNATNPPMAVQLFIHGGEYITGDVNYAFISPQRYMDVDTVLVASQYRLGAIGFLSTNDEAASGNFGLLDQNLALKWIQRNIAAFGGNPNDVTLTGQSAGSSSVIYQYLSPMSAGLFHRAIGESGTAISPWALEENPLYYAKAMGEHFNCTTDDTTQLVDCLRQIDADVIQAHTLEMIIKNLTLVFVPVVETSPSGQFLTEDPLTMLEEGHFNRVPLQLGFNRDEGCIIYEWAYVFFENVTDFTFDVVIPFLLDAVTDYKTNLVNISYAIKDHYYADVDFDNDTQVNIAAINWLSDIVMKSGVAKTAALVSSHNVTTYLYYYEYVSSHSASNFTGEPDVLHGDEMQYLWYRNITDAKDEEFGSRFFTLWANFILHGSPSNAVADDHWSPVLSGQYNYYDVQQQFTMRGNYDPDDMNFWWYTVPIIANS